MRELNSVDGHCAQVCVLGIHPFSTTMRSTTALSNGRGRNGSTTSDTATTTTSSKKKFGKNLNKLIKPVTAPNRSSNTSNSSSRNGLLLLSTNRKSSLLSSSSSTTSAPSTSAASANGTTTSTTASKGSASNSGGSSGGGLLASKSSGNTATTASSSSGSAPTDTSTSQAATAPSTTPTKTMHHHSSLPYESKAASTHDVLLSAVVGAAAQAEQPNQKPDAWGVSAATATTPNTTTTTSAEKNEPNTSNMYPENPSSNDAYYYGGEDNNHHNYHSLGQYANTYGGGDYVPQQQNHHQPMEGNWDDYGGRGDTHHHRTLVDIGSGSDNQGAVMSRLARERTETRRAEEDFRMKEQRDRAAQRLRELDETSGNKHQSPQLASTPPTTRSGWDMTRTGSRGLWEPDQVTSNNINAADGIAQATGDNNSRPVIHLSSYEDRDRGEQNTNGGPRMLYDPKSGSMVAVKGREEASGAGRKRGGAKKNRKERSGSEGKSEANDSAKNNGRKNQKATNKKEILGDGKGKRVNPKRRLPRTCGVLYARDNKGSCYCADDCDGDLGYGAHSVPGGRTRNPDAYAEYMKQTHGAGYEQIVSQLDYGGMYDANQEVGDGTGGDVSLYTGFQAGYGLLQPEPVEYVRASDKLELVTGVESPTLKPTAREWAPSQAALAAAAAVQAKSVDVSTDTSDVDTAEKNHGIDQGDDDDDDDGPLGLGFDPTQDMAFVIQSPSHESAGNAVDSIAMSALALEPPMYAPNSGGNRGPRHIFAFGSSGTWGLHQGASNSDWKVPTNTGEVISNAVLGGDQLGGLFGSGAFRGSGTIDESRESTSFLNIPASSSWDSPGFGGLPTGGDDRNAQNGG